MKKSKARRLRRNREALSMPGFDADERQIIPPPDTTPGIFQVEAGYRLGFLRREDVEAFTRRGSSDDVSPQFLLDGGGQPAEFASIHDVLMYLITCGYFDNVMAFTEHQPGKDWRDLGGIA